MEKKTYQTSINAPREKVWQVLWDEEKYKAWTSVFAPDSTVETDNWKEGSRVLFHDGKGNGMVSMVEANRPNEYMSFKHLGVIKEGKEEMDNEKNREWTGAHENYTLTGQNGKTELRVDMDIADEYRDYFEKTWPLALEKIKELAES